MSARPRFLFEWVDHSNDCVDELPSPATTDVRSLLVSDIEYGPENNPLDVFGDPWLSDSEEEDEGFKYDVLCVLAMSEACICVIPNLTVASSLYWLRQSIVMQTPWLRLPLEFLETITVHLFFRGMELFNLDRLFWSMSGRLPMCEVSVVFSFADV